MRSYTVRMIPDGGDKLVPMVAVYNGMVCEALLQPITTAFASFIGQRLAKLGAVPAWTLEKEGENDEEAAVKEAG